MLPLHNPVELAEAGAFLDVITGGKFLLGVELGYRPEEFQIFGVPVSERVSRFIEAVEIIRRLWSEDRVTHSGRHWQFSDAAIAPHPLQAPRPPILIGAQVDAAIARAARIGDGLLSVPTVTLDQLDAQISKFKSARSATKLPPAEHFCRLLEVGCAADDDTAIRRSAPFLMEKYKSYVSWGLEGLTLDPSAAPEQQFRALASKRFAVGAPASVIDMLVAQHRCGINHLSMRVSWPGMGQDNPRQHRASWPQGSSRRAAQNRGHGAVAPPSKVDAAVLGFDLVDQDLGSGHVAGVGEQYLDPRHRRLGGFNRALAGAGDDHRGALGLKEFRGLHTIPHAARTTMLNLATPRTSLRARNVH